MEFADPDIPEAIFGTDETSGYTTLTVPCLEMYMFLSLKMKLANSALN